MARIDVRFKIEKLQIRQYPRAELVAGGKNYFYAIFDICDTWDDIEQPKALFTRGQTSKLMSLTLSEYGLECEIPWEVMTEPGVFEVGIFGGDRLLTNTDYVVVKEGTMTDGEEPLAPTPDWFSTIEKDIENMKKEGQSDWNENDATKMNHVKNRTHYETEPEVLCDFSFTEADLKASGGGYILEFYVKGEIDLSYEQYGSTSVLYECSRFDDSWDIPSDKGLVYWFIENDSLNIGVYDDGSYDRTSGRVRFWLSESTRGSIKLWKPGKVVPLPEKYIPDTIARTADVEEILDELHKYAKILTGGDA